MSGGQFEKSKSGTDFEKVALISVTASPSGRSFPTRPSFLGMKLAVARYSKGQFGG
jgi:hypothetical protein